MVNCYAFFDVERFHKVSLRIKYQPQVVLIGDVLELKVDISLKIGVISVKCWASVGDNITNRFVLVGVRAAGSFDNLVLCN